MVKNYRLGQRVQNRETRARRAIDGALRMPCSAAIGRWGDAARSNLFSLLAASPRRRVSFPRGSRSHAFGSSTRVCFSDERLAIKTATADLIAFSGPQRTGVPVLTDAQNSEISLR